MGGQPTQTTQTTKVELSPEQREILSLAMPGFRQYAANPPQRYPGSQIAGFDPLQTQGQELALGATGQQTSLAGSAADANRFMLGPALDPTTNPALRATIAAATRPITETLTEKALPAIRNEAVTTGNFGSSRQGIAEAQAIRDATRQVGDTTAKISTDAYGRGLDAMGRALALTPQTQQAQLSPAVTTSGVGDIRQALAQALLGEQVAGFNYDQMLPFLMSKDLASIVSGLPGTGATTTASGPQQNTLFQALGLGASGLSALMPLLLASDRRIKEDIEKVGRLDNGLPIYSFRFKGESRYQVGLMADEVETQIPEAVHVTDSGLLMVDYYLATRNRKG